MPTVISSFGGALADELADVVQKRLGIKRVRADTLVICSVRFGRDIQRGCPRSARGGRRHGPIMPVGTTSGSVVIKRVGDYAAKYELADLNEIAARTRHMPDAFINAEGNGVTEAFRGYLRPLLGDDLPAWSDCGRRWSSWATDPVRFPSPVALAGR